jgi:hypothetical protein
MVDGGSGRQSRGSVGTKKYKLQDLSNSSRLVTG